jgi:preprotein translocase subunit SecD
MRWILLFLGLAGLMASAAAAATRTFTVGGEAFVESEIIDARGLPQLDGTSTVMITFSDKAAQRLEAITKKLAQKPMPVMLDDKALANPQRIEPNVIEVGGFETIDQASDMAKRISGKDPLPDELEGGL